MQWTCMYVRVWVLVYVCLRLKMSSMATGSELEGGCQMRFKSAKALLFTYKGWGDDGSKIVHSLSVVPFHLLYFFLHFAKKLPLTSLLYGYVIACLSELKDRYMNDCTRFEEIRTMWNIFIVYVNFEEETWWNIILWETKQDQSLNKNSSLPLPVSVYLQLSVWFFSSS